MDYPELILLIILALFFLIALYQDQGFGFLYRNSF